MAGGFGWLDGQPQRVSCGRGAGSSFPNHGCHLAHGLHGYTVEPDMPIPELSPNEYEILIVPGGRSPEKLRLQEEAVNQTTVSFDGDVKLSGVLATMGQRVIGGVANTLTKQFFKNLESELVAGGN